MALQCMIDKKSGELTTAKEVVSQTGVPFDATARVLQVMGQSGLLKSEQGAHGGYSIIRDLNSVSFFELVEMILGPIGLAKCLHSSDACELLSSCNIKEPIARLNDRLSEFYKTVMIGDLLNSQGEGSARAVNSSILESL